MSWFRKALSITTAYDDSYYTAIDPGEFYEWRFKGSIPKGKVFSKKLPPSEIFTRGMIIACVRLPEDVLNKGSFGFSTKHAVDTEIFLQAGQIQSPGELVQRYHRIKDQFYNSIQDFKKACRIRYYFTSGKQKELFRISFASNDEPKLHTFGPMSEILKELASKQKQLSDETLSKQGRSYEMESFKRFKDAMMFASNPQIPLDSMKIDTLLISAGVESKSISSISWHDCYVKVVPEAEATKKLLDNYESMSWVRASL